ncbi:MAG: hypothetical protein ACKVOK_09350 [Flavobacteriales bacterium]
MYTRMKWITAILLFIGVSNAVIAQETPKATLAVMNLDAQGLNIDPATISYIVRLEVDKTDVYTVIDKYEMADVFKGAAQSVEACFSRTCLINAGKLLNADKILCGDITQFESKIIISLRLIDVKTGVEENSESNEFLNIQKEMQKMIEISVKKLFGIAPDPLMVNQLINYDVPVSSPQTTLSLNGPRMGATYTLGETGNRMTASAEDGGFDMYRTSFQFGYQKEVQYLSAGNFQALIEVVGQVSGLENGRFIPSLTVLNGFRWGNSGWEVGFGPTFRFVRKADGFFDTDGILGEKGAWHLEDAWQDSLMTDQGVQHSLNPYRIVSRLDSRGQVKGSTGLVLAVGRTFKSGYLNVPFNVWVSPRKDGTIVGFSFGFNVSRKPK